MFQKVRSIFIIFSILFSLNLQSDQFNSEITLNDVNYNFDTIKLETVDNPFSFFRTFVDFYYIILKSNLNQLPTLQSRIKNIGWCVGDAHPENFGFLIDKKSESIFTMNDIDDSGPCPLILDIYRLFISYNLHSNNINIANALENYLHGLNHEITEMPNTLKELKSKSINKGQSVPSELVENSQLIRNSTTMELTKSELDEITQKLLYLIPILNKPFQILDSISYRKKNGGSAGLLRYHLLIKNDPEPILIELKEQTIPAVSIFSSDLSPIPETKERIFLALNYTYPREYSSIYNVINLSGRQMLVRPRFEGNLAFKLGKTSNEEALKIFNYEFYQLGLIHSKSIKNLDEWGNSVKNIQQNMLMSEINLLTEFFKKKYKSLKD